MIWSQYAFSLVKDYSYLYLLSLVLVFDQIDHLYYRSVYRQSSETIGGIMFLVKFALSRPENNTKLYRLCLHVLTDILYNRHWVMQSQFY